MRILQLFGCFLIFMFFGCKKDKSSPQQGNDSPLHYQPSCEIISGSLIVNNYDTTTFFYRFDPEGRIIRSVYYDYKNDSTVISYFYQDNRISMSEKNGDTTFYSYNSKGLLKSKTTQDGRTDEFLYNSSQEVVKSRVWFLINSSMVLADSTYYTWSDGNMVSSITHYRPNLGNWITLTQLYSYDNMFNYMKATGLPQSDFKSWSKNNLTKCTIVEYPEMNFSYNFLEYNSAGFPTRINWQMGQYNYTEILNYRCW